MENRDLAPVPRKTRRQRRLEGRGVNLAAVCTAHFRFVTAPKLRSPYINALHFVKEIFSLYPNSENRTT